MSIIFKIVTLSTIHEIRIDLEPKPGVYREGLSELAGNRRKRLDRIDG